LTIILTQLTLGQTVHATDSLLTKRSSRRLAKGSGQAKFLGCPQFRGGFSWFGQITAGRHWNAKTFLEQRIKDLPNPPMISSDQFASEIAKELTYRLTFTHISKSMGLGLHFTTYDLGDGEWIPELFLITNYTGLEYRGGLGFVAQRQTYHWLSNNTDTNFADHFKDEFRIKVKQQLQKTPIHFSNGQPTVFARFIPQILETVATHPVSNVPFWTGYPLQLCQDMTDYYLARKGKKKALVGHPCFDLPISP